MAENIGTKIKRLRTDAGLTWGDLAEACGLQSSQIALIESGEVTPSISTLIKMARRLSIRVGTLLDGTEATSPSVAGISSVEPTINTSNSKESTHLDFFSLAGGKSDRNMEPFYINVGYVENSKNNYSSHEGEEFIFVLEGEIDIFYGTEKHTLKHGQSIYYDSIVPHLVSVSDKDRTAKVLAVTYTPN